MRVENLVKLGLCLILCGISLADFNPQENLFMYLPMDEPITSWVHDTQGNMGGEVKGFTSMPAVWAAGKFGQCFNGNGIQNRIALAADIVGTNVLATTAIGNFQNKTVAAWICPVAATSPVGNTVQFIFGLVNGADQPYKFYLAMTSGSIRVQSTEGYQQYTLPVIDGNTWYHIAVVNANTEDGMSEYRLYIDGVLRLTKTGVARDEVGKHYHPSIGSSVADITATDAARSAFYGKIDEFRIYDAVLTGEQIVELMALEPEPMAPFRPQDDLELYYTFDQEGGDNLIIDSSGNDLYGVMNNYDGNTDQWINGVYGKCFNLDGTTNSVSFKDRNNEYAFGEFENKTISCWIRPDDTSGIQQMFNISPGTYKYYFYLQEYYLRLQGVSTTAGNEIIQTVAQIPAQQWTHIAAVIRECTDLSICCEVYINGIQAGFKKLYKNSNATRAYGLTIGAGMGFDPTKASGWFDGAIDDFRIYDKDLMPSDVNDIYNGGPVFFGDVDGDSSVGESDLQQFAGSWIDSAIETPSSVVAFEKGGFEEYADQAALDAYWSDFGQSASIGSTAMSMATLLTNPADSHSGGKALRWDYNTNDFSGNNARFTDLLFTLGTPVDMTGYDYLSLWIKRAPGNAQQTGVYVKLLNGGVGFTNVAATSIITYNQGSTAHPADVWDNWLVDLNRLLYTSGVPAAIDNVQGLVLGCYAVLGNEGIGTIDIDDIELLTAPICYDIIDADINGDCVVDMEDYSTLAKDWMSN